MKILLAHNHYRSSAPSGEDMVFKNELALLQKHAQVVTFEKYNDHIDETTVPKQIQLALAAAWSRRSYSELTQLIRDTRPDVAHFHNTFPLISASAYAACRDQGIPVVQTLHNYRLICPAALLWRHGMPCEDCVGTSLWPALRYRCYRNSLLATGAQVWSLASNRWRGSYQELVNVYIALTQFAASKFVAGGLPAERIVVKPNFLDTAPEQGKGDGGYAVFVGRLSVEKGVKTLIEAWRQLVDVPLKLVGDGPLKNDLTAMAQQANLPVEFLGYRSHQETLDIVGNATLQIIPSEWYEGMNMVLVEAYACGTPVIVSAIGSLDELVDEGQTGLKFTPGDSDDLVSKVRAFLANPSAQRRMRDNVRRVFQQRYTAEQNISQLMAIYDQATA